MGNKLHRRSFLTRFSLGLASLISIPFTSIGKTNRSDKNENPIIKVKPLGFQWESKDPFLFCVHHEDDFPKGNENMGPITSLKGRDIGNDFIIKDGFRMYHGKTVPGFPGHPHKGFETITVVRKGLVDHTDSTGAAGRYGNGDVQWMTAGKGILHAEMFPLLNKNEKNPLELFQIWLNLPSKDKNVSPHFKMLWNDEVPIYFHKDSKGKETKLEVIAGSINGVNAASPPPNSWASKYENEVAIWNIMIESNGEWKLPAASEGINRMLYFYEGNKVEIAGNDIPKYSSVELKADESLMIKAKEQPVSILILQGKPIDEEVVSYGPFVMNSKDEIRQAYEEYNQTRFGGWPWKRYDYVHPREKGRFAKHSNGKVIEKG